MKPYWTNGRTDLHLADARAIPLPDESVHCVVTSPPYWGLRDYQLLQWEGGDAGCNHSFGRVGSARADGIVDETKPVRNRDGAAAAPTQCRCGAKQVAAGIGLESTLHEWIDNLVIVFREVWRVLRDDGVLWLNLGDAYTSGNRATYRSSASENKGHQVQDDMPRPKTPDGLQSKALMGQPWRVAFALQDDGWILRSAVIWHKNNPMPEAATDRPTNTYELIFMLVKSNTSTYWTHRDLAGSRTAPAEPDYRWIHKESGEESATSPIGWHTKRRCPGGRDGCAICNSWRRINLWNAHDYFYDADAIREPQAESTLARFAEGQAPRRPPKKSGGSDRWNQNFYESAPESILPTGRNARNVWNFPVQGRSDAHFAAYPDELPKRAILASTSAYGVCAECGAPWRRVTESHLVQQYASRHGGYAARGGVDGMVDLSKTWTPGVKETETLGWLSTCRCDAPVAPAVVLDPFIGSGTTCEVANALGRLGVGLDLNPEYLAIAINRITNPPTRKTDWYPNETFKGAGNLPT